MDLYKVKIPIVLLLLVIGCNDNPTEYEFKTAFVYKTIPVHRGYGFYKLRAFYEFNFKDTIYQDDYLHNKTTKLTSRKDVSSGDSILIKFPKGNPNESEVVKLVFVKSRNYHID